ncbi:fungal-specific transcription factor domain-containing protein [Aspergillus cavernicola]|uniref:Fungal-specific transcription factor domain-containing protein n=1 Tax=Aspergillus cavernicola TaxID=176166 RepID=A0ABR4IBG8_9EURO
MCDRHEPGCWNCVRSGRVCPGYGVRLSWPDENNQRRAVVFEPISSLLPGVDGQPVATRFIGVTCWDIEMHYFTTSKYLHRDSQVYYPPSQLKKAKVWEPSMDGQFKSELIAYFRHVASKSLILLPDNQSGFCDLLLQLAVYNTNPTSRAVLYSLLALSSTHRYGYHSAANQLKVKAIVDLRSSIHGELTYTEALQHIAAGMLLCYSEIFEPSESSFQWPLYIAGVKRVAQTISSDDTAHGEEWSILFSWIYYHDVLALFSLLHWRRASFEREELVRSQRLELRLAITQARTNINVIFGCSPEMLDLLADVFQFCGTFTHKSTWIYRIEEQLLFHNTRLMRTRQQLLLQGLTKVESSHIEDIAELYRLAALIYLHRMSGPLPGASTDIRIYKKLAFDILSRLLTCERAFPLSIVGCEAETDEQRSLVLSIISKTQRESNIRSLACVERLVKTKWIQDDLDEADTLPYSCRLSLIISSSDFLPTFI